MTVAVRSMPHQRRHLAERLARPEHGAGAAAVLRHGGEAREEDVEAVGVLALGHDRVPAGTSSRTIRSASFAIVSPGQRPEQPHPLELGDRGGDVAGAHAGYGSA